MSQKPRGLLEDIGKESRRLKAPTTGCKWKWKPSAGVGDGVDSSPGVAQHNKVVVVENIIGVDG